MIDLSTSLFDIFPISSCSCFCICFCFEFCGWFCFQNDFKLLVFVASRLSFRCYESTHFPKWGKVNSTNPCAFIRWSRFFSLLSLKLKLQNANFKAHSLKVDQFIDLITIIMFLYLLVCNFMNEFEILESHNFLCISFYFLGYLLFSPTIRLDLLSKWW